MLWRGQLGGEGSCFEAGNASAVQFDQVFRMVGSFLDSSRPYFRESISSYATLVATYVASFTIAQVALKAADIGLETSDGLLKWTGNEKVKHDVMVLLTLHYS